MVQQRLEATISGRVQMVMYRDFVQRYARKLGIAGWVQNNDDGTVTVVAVGDPETLKKFEFQLQKGSVGSRVDDVEASYSETKQAEKFYGFEIRF
ncbi:hypothetical protein A3A21_03275 [Candidatus Jorgensenbacteria bacterium RIFCSPLOWO2_01_FULL_45_25b]|uniref:acylphosphatase n=1 Tax=Candidatus Jorgensenbacteria bacterium RIFCSPLOWO2_01_FULL_45_25b TaxID=1798471 RepID=A0A1F6BU24_9BACT|nr:MAG: hypothetical protein A3A21_03275 [Candidatus Jorgensenbacteria bacterium RIFCSPLOWO2_01_FULL_45_25b]